MNVYVNGCSFSYGVDQNNKFAWPDLLPYDVVNESWPAGSNKRIFRRTKEYLDNNNVDFVILQLTDFLRDEFYDEKYNVWIGQQGENLFFDDKSFKDKSVNRKLLLDRWDQYKRINVLTRTNALAELETFYMVNSITRYLYIKNIPYIFTAMSSGFMPTQMINREHLVKPISHIITDNTVSDKDLHPNEAGHRLFADYIINEVEKRI